MDKNVQSQEQQKKEMLRLVASCKGDLGATWRTIVVGITIMGGVMGLMELVKAMGTTSIDGTELLAAVVSCGMIGMIIASGVESIRNHRVYNNLVKLQDKNLSARQIARIQRICEPDLIRRASEQDVRYIENLLSGGLQNAPVETVRAISKGGIKNRPEQAKRLKQFNHQKYIDGLQQSVR